MRVFGIFITGPSSTGKTFLCNALNNRLKEMGIFTYHVSEVARKVMREQSFTRSDVGTLVMQRAILKAQIRAEEDAITHILSESRPKSPQEIESPIAVLLCDRCAVDPVVYATMMLPGGMVDELMVEHGLEEFLMRYRGKTLLRGTLLETGVYLDPLVVLTDGVDEWKVDDGVRSLYDPKTVTVVFREVLERLKIEYLEIGEEIKDIEERTSCVLAAAGLKNQLSTRGAKAML